MIVHVSLGDIVVAVLVAIVLATITILKWSQDRNRKP